MAYFMISVNKIMAKKQWIFEIEGQLAGMRKSMMKDQSAGIFLSAGVFLSQSHDAMMRGGR